MIWSRRGALPLAITLSAFGACQCDPILDRRLTAVGTDPAASFMGVGGVGDDVWVVGAVPRPGLPPAVLHGRDGAFSVVDTRQAHDLWWVHAFPEANGREGPVFIGGGGATLLRLDPQDAEGTTYETLRLRSPGFAGLTVFGVWGADPQEVWAVGGFAGRQGFAWRTAGVDVHDVPIPENIARSADGELPALLKVWGRARDDVWIVGGQGTVLRWRGSALEVVDPALVGDHTDTFFTVTGAADRDEVVIVGGAALGVLLRGNDSGFVDDTPPGAPLLQGVAFGADGTLYASGADGFLAAQRQGSSEWERLDSGTTAPSLHAVWEDGDGGLYAVGGGVLTPALDLGVVSTNVAMDVYTAVPPPPPSELCPESALDPFPQGSMARRMREQHLNAIRRSVPNPPLHARNLFHVAAAMWDAHVAYDTDAARASLFLDAAVDVDAVTDLARARDEAVAMAAYRVLVHRYKDQQGAAVTRACLDGFMATIGIDIADERLVGNDGVAVGNRVGFAIIEAGLDDGSNERGGHADTTSWQPTNPVLVVDRPGVRLDDPNTWQQLNLALAETQNGIVLDASVQPYLGPQWKNTRPFAAERDPDSGRYSPPTAFPQVTDAKMVDELVELIRLEAELDPTDGDEIDISPGARGDNTLGTNDGNGHDVNPVTGAPYASNMVKRGDFLRVIAEMWADGPQSETPPGHWMKLASEVTDAMLARGDRLVPFGDESLAEVDLLTWDVGIGLVVAGATHDAAIAAWELKRDSLGPRPISLIRHFGQRGQRSDPALPSYDPEGLPLVPGIIELITATSSAPGERHAHLRHFQGELAVRGWPGEPGDRKNEFTRVQWMRVKDWIPYQRRTFVTPAFPGFISGHSTFSRAAAEALTAYTGTPFFPGGMHEFVARQGNYLVFEDGPTRDVHLQWATYFDAADQSGQSRLAGGIHIFADDTFGRVVGSRIGQRASARARELWGP